MGQRRGLSSTLILGAIVLLIAIAVGNSMGNRVLRQVASRIPIFSTTPLPIATPSDEPLGGAANGLRWKRRQVISVATDPAFPDPRITPEPTPPPTPVPTPGRERNAGSPAAGETPYYRRHHRYEPVPSLTPEPVKTEAPARVPYTSPPMLIPMPRHGAEETAAPIETSPPGPSASRAAVVGPTSAP